MSSRALAQDSEPVEAPVTEEAGRSRGGYAWGEGAEEQQAEARPPTHRFGNVFLSLGAGGTVRMLVYQDVCPPDTTPGCRFSPPYLQLRGGWFFEGDGDIQHGVGLGVASNLSPEGSAGIGIDPFAQWVLSPTYFLRYWFDQWFQLMAHFGVPLGVTNVTGTATQGSIDFNWGLELQVGVVFKFLQGLGIYAAASVASYFGAEDALVWPTLSFEGGLVFDYEVLP